jgi:hypothetical protein
MSGPKSRGQLAADPVNLQPQASSSKVTSDPVYGQEHQSPADSPGPAHTKSSGTTAIKDDPVYSQANSRLQQLSSHISSTPSEPLEANTKRSGKKKKSNDASADLPADYSDILGQFKKMIDVAATPDPASRGYERQKTSGKLWHMARAGRRLRHDAVEKR